MIHPYIGHSHNQKKLIEAIGMNQASSLKVKPLGLVIPEGPLNPASGLSPSEGPVHSRQVSGHEAGLVFLPVPVAYKVDRTEKVKVSKINSLKEPHLA